METFLINKVAKIAFSTPKKKTKKIRTDCNCVSVYIFTLFSMHLFNLHCPVSLGLATERSQTQNMTVKYSQ